MEKFPKICYLNYVRRGITVLVHGHTENSFSYHPLIDILVGYWQDVAPSKGKLYQGVLN